MVPTEKNCPILQIRHWLEVGESWKWQKKTNHYLRRVWRYQGVNRRRTDNTMAKRKVQRDKQRSIKHTHKAKDRVTRTSLKTGGKLRCSGRVSSSCSTSGIRRVNQFHEEQHLIRLHRLPDVFYISDNQQINWHQTS